MVLVKILGAIDFVAAIILLCMIFSLDLPLQLLLVTGGLLFVKSLFILSGDFLSVIDLFASITLFIGIFFTPWIFLLWILSLFLMSKGAASFL
ncbi:hypothetical protein FJZ21_02775 [Candidatus Pacearchaeota archaeon]|nr:hypothetical protein [Candidatus Pacearchaeota archaeon]